MANFNISATRQAIAVTPIKTSIIQGQVSLPLGGTASFRVETDGAYTGGYGGSGFNPVGADTQSQYASSMGFLLSVFALAAAGIEGQEIRIEQAINGAAAWTPVRTDVLIGGAPYLQRGVAIAAPFARVTLANNSGGPVAIDLAIYAMTQ